MLKKLQKKRLFPVHSVAEIMVIWSAAETSFSVLFMVCHVIKKIILIFEHLKSSFRSGAHIGNL